MKYEYLTEKTYETEKALISYRLASDSLLEIRKAQRELEELERLYKVFREKRNAISD